MSITYRLAKLSDLPTLDNILHQAVIALKQQGVNQWQNHSVTKQDLELTIERQSIVSQPYVWELNNQIIGFALLQSTDPYYRQLKSGKFSFHGDYFAIHRVMVSDKAIGKRVTKQMFSDIQQIAHSQDIQILRIDTHPDNSKMQHIIVRENFKYCGTTIVGDGGLRLVYEKNI